MNLSSTAARAVYGARNVLEGYQCRRSSLWSC